MRDKVLIIALGDPIRWGIKSKEHDNGWERQHEELEGDHVGSSCFHMADCTPGSFMLNQIKFKYVGTLKTTNIYDKQNIPKKGRRKNCGHSVCQ